MGMMKPRTLSKRQLWLYGALALVGYWGLLALLWWVSAGRMEVGFFALQPLFQFVPFFLIARIFGKKNRVLREPTETGLAFQSVLEQEGLTGITVTLGESGDPATFPRLIAMGNSVMVPQRVMTEYSEPALLWSLKTDAAAARWFMPFLVLCGGVAVLLMFTIAIFERLRVPNYVYGWTAGIWVLILFGGLIWLGTAMPCTADRRFTKTDADRAAAKEALSYAYFAQADLSPMKRKMYLRWELTTRAKRLGIELERGFRADVHLREENSSHKVGSLG